MKKVFSLLIASTLLLGACSSGGSSTNENKLQFKNNTLVLDQAVVKIKHKMLVNNKDINQKVLTIEYEVKNKTNKKDINATSVWIAAMNAKQDGDNTENNLNVGATPNTGKFKEWFEHSNDTIKKGKYVKGIVSYELQNNKDVELVATHGVGGKKLGTQNIKLEKLKTVDYSAADDINSESASNENGDNTQDSTNDTQSSKSGDSNNTEKVVASTNSSGQTQTTSNKTVAQTQDNGGKSTNQPTANIQSNNQINPDFVKHNDEQSMKWQNENAAPKPDSHGGGHPSTYDKSISPDEDFSGQ